MGVQENLPINLYLTVCQRGQILASQILPSVEELQHLMIHEPKGKLYPQNHVSLYSYKCCRASVLFFYQPTISLTFQDLHHQSLQVFHIKISIQELQL